LRGPQLIFGGVAWGCRIKFASFSVSGTDTYGVIAGAGVVDLGASLHDRYPSLRALLAAGEAGVAAAVSVSEASHTSVPFSDVIWRPVIPNPDKILCVGLNFREHIHETGRQIGNYPVIFLRLAASQVGHLQPILRPKVSDQLDFEGELAVIIGAGGGRRGRYIAAERTLEHVAGYSIYNDASIREWQRHTHQYTPGKNFPNTGAFGPWMVTADEIPDPGAFHLTTRLNGQVVQDSGLNDLVFDIPQLISYISNFAELLPGDVIITGTPSGVGAARKPPLWMKPGDRVEVEISSIGTLSNPIAQEP
jgi:2-keto-4-pentenoate hydratase/2-oxohepta-3-ene-1,7-dioic acid hydratase in catechol pathway